MAAGALAGPGEKKKAAAALEGLEKATAGFVGVDKAPPAPPPPPTKFVTVARTTPVPVGLGVSAATAALAGVGTAVAGVVDEVIGPGKVLFFSCKEFEVFQWMCTNDV